MLFLEGPIFFLDLSSESSFQPSQIFLSIRLRSNDEYDLSLRAWFNLYLNDHMNKNDLISHQSELNSCLEILSHSQ